MKKLVVALLLLTPAFASAETPLIKLKKSNTLSLNGEVTQQSAGILMKEARQMDQTLFSSDDPIYLILNTPGGDVEAGIALAEFLNGLHRPVETITIFAASMGFQIAQQLKERHIVRYGTLMSHRARGSVAGEFGGIEPSQMGSRFAFWSKKIRELDEQTVRRTRGKQTLASYEHAYISELWLTGEDAVAKGYADDIVHAFCDSSIKGTESHKADVMGFSISYETDACPLNTGLLGVTVGVTTNRGLMSEADFLAKGGSFAPECLTESATNPNKVCALNTTLSFDKLNQAKEDFVKSKSNNYQIN